MGRARNQPTAVSADAFAAVMGATRGQTEFAREQAFKTGIAFVVNNSFIAVYKDGRLDETYPPRSYNFWNAALCAFPDEVLVVQDAPANDDVLHRKVFPRELHELIGDYTEEENEWRLVSRENDQWLGGLYKDGKLLWSGPWANLSIEQICDVIGATAPVLNITDEHRLDATPEPQIATMLPWGE